MDKMVVYVSMDGVLFGVIEVSDVLWDDVLVIVKVL